MKNRLKFGDSFCILPWIEEYRELDGEKYVCCLSSEPINDTRQLLASIWDNEKISNCSYCYELEDKKTISPRQVETALWLKNESVKKLLATDTCPEKTPLFYDLRLSNKCNLACISCSPKYSSLWARELNQIEPDRKFDFDIDKILNSEKVYFAGGEPLIIDEYLNIIDIIAEKNRDIEVVINTNLTRIDDGLLESLTKIKNVSFTVSVDAYGAVNEYHRYPLRWNKFVNNLEKINDTNIFINFNTVVDAVSVFGFTDFKILERKTNSWNLVILQRPEVLHLSNVPKNLKEIANFNIEELKSIRFYKENEKFKSTVDSLKDVLYMPGNSKLLSSFIQELDTRRNINHYNFLGVNLIEK